jgi:hypothetical protein
MKVTALALFAALAGAAVPAGAARAADMQHLRAMAGEYSDVVLADPVLDAALREGLGAEYASFRDQMQVVFPAEIYDDRFLVLTGCRQHDCDAHRGLVLVDLEGGAVQVIRSNLYGGYIPLSAAAEAAIDAWNH